MKELTDKEIKEFLEEIPLYSWREFNKPRVNRSSLFINAIDVFCETCQRIRPFHDMRSRGGGAGMSVKALSTGQTYFEFSCVTCKKQQRRYSVEQVVNEKTVRIQKFGELPRRQIERDKLLQKFFSDDSDCYEKSMVCLSHGYGIAAFVYLRRIVENNIFKLIDLLLEDVKTSEDNKSLVEALTKLRKESPMSERIDIANHALPSYLKADGINPLGKLFKVLSKGVHSYTDQECLDRANSVKGCLIYLISELSTRKKNRRHFKSAIGSL